MRTAMVSLLIALAFTACASASKTYGPDGREAFTFNCSGWTRSWGMCYEKAGELCGTSGYDVIGQNVDHGVAVSPGFGGSLISRNLFVGCKSGSTPPVAGPALVGLSGTFGGEISGTAYGRAYALRVTFTLVQTGDQIAGVWNTTGGTSGTISALVRGAVISAFRAKQLNPCDGEFTGTAAVEENGARLRGNYAGSDCNGSIDAAFIVNRRSQ